uniref:Disease resistance protein n=1 Tax=Quercus lobata TaxID=97700 RepID=A0A7N2LBR4_QUELO
MQNVVDATDASEADLKMQNLYFLTTTGSFIISSRALHHRDGRIKKVGFWILWKWPLWTQAFQSLRTLLFEELPSWTHWIHLANEGEHFPSLQQLHIRGCPKLIGNLPKHLRSLKEMKLHDLDALTTLSQELFEGNSSFQQLEIVNCPSLSSFPGGDSLTNVKTLSICDCRNLKPFLLEHTMHPFRVLESLQIMRSCDSLQSVLLGLFTKLQDLHIEDCRNLKSLSIPNNLHFDLILLRKMTFKDCPNLEFFPVKGLPTPNLQSLLITNCNNLMPQKEWGLHRMVSLTCFEIEGGCSNLELFPEEGLLPNTLTSLRISRLPHLKFIGQGLHHLTLLGKLEINCCEKLELMPEEGLPASLFYLHIQNWSLLADPCQKDGTKKSNWRILKKSGSTSEVFMQVDVSLYNMLRSYIGLPPAPSIAVQFLYR